MVVKIQPATSNITAAVVYNENKMTAAEGILSPQDAAQYDEHREEGHVLVTRNVPQGSSLEDEFERLRLKNERNSKGRRLQNPTFHMSINPGEGDRPMNEDDIVAFADELMQSLGYGDNPYRIFRHDDTGRTHYHVVATRIGPDGRKVKDSYENRRCENICRGLAAKYGYTYGLQEEAVQQESERQQAAQETAGTNAQQPQSHAKEKAKKDGRPYVKPFALYSDIPATQQYKDFHGEAMQWSFSTPEQYAALLALRFNTKVEIYNDEYLTYAGTDGKGKVITPPVSERELEMDALRDVLEKCAKANMKVRRSQRERLEKLSVWAAEQSQSWKDFVRLMHKKGVYVVISWTQDGKPFGITWLDRATRCAWKGSETATGLQWLLATAQEKGWKMARRKDNIKAEKQAAASPQRNNKGTGRTLAEYSDAGKLRRLLERHSVNTSHGSQQDASKNRGELERRDDNDIII